MTKKPTAKKSVKEKTASKYKYNNVLVAQRKDGITFLILNRPEKRNAMSPELHHEMDDALERLANLSVDPSTLVHFVHFRDTATSNYSRTFLFC